MVPLSLRDSATPLLGAPEALDALLARVRAADTLYQAWAAVALIHAGDARHRRVGREMARALRAKLPSRSADWEHGDVACFAVLADATLTQEERTHVVRAVPKPNDQVERRARFYNSPLYVYLSARGLAGELPDAARLAAFVVRDATQMVALPGSDLTSLVLQLATVLELQPVMTVDAELLKAMHARLVTGSGEPQGAIAVRWLVERYAGKWPGGPDATELRLVAERYGARYDPTAVSPNELRPEVAVMRLETLVGRESDYRLVQSADVRREVAAQVGRRHIVASGAYAVSLAVLWGAPAWALVAKAGAPLGITLGTALMTWVPSALWATLWEYGRLRRDGTLAGTVALSLSFYAYLAYVVLSGSTLGITFSEAVQAIVPVVIGTMFGAAPALREASEISRSDS